jgi:RecB family endonuclease NucS
MREPVNWQPTVASPNSKQRMMPHSQCRHLKPPEKMKVIFRQLKLVTATSLVDRANLVIAGMEIDVVNQINQVILSSKMASES